MMHDTGRLEPEENPNDKEHAARVVFRTTAIGGRISGVIADLLLFSPQRTLT